jgi:pimeloyl-ACP methyl ester carboxylesterase
MTVPVRHLKTKIGGVDIFYREAGPADAPVLLLPHGYPCSSYEFRNYMAHLGDRWRLLAPDFPAAATAPRPGISPTTLMASPASCMTLPTDSALAVSRSISTISARRSG